MDTILWSESPASGRYAVTLDWPVGWGDLDAFGHVNNTVYFRYFEHVRIAYFRAIGMLEHMKSTQIGPILGHTDCRFRLPLAYPDELTLGARVAELGSDRFLMHYRVFSKTQQAVAAYGTGRLVTFDYATQTKAPLDGALRTQIVALESTQDS